MTTPTEAERQKAHEVWNEALCNSGVPGWNRVDAFAQALADQRGDLVTHLQQHRRACLRELRASTDADADYWRWQGHAELARQLLTRLGAEVPQ